MRPTPRQCVAVVITGLAVVGLVACSDRSDDDVDAFCAAYHDLGENNPFAHLAMATPSEMEAAFDQLVEAAGDIADAAPSSVSAHADRYLAAVHAVVDELDAAQFDPRNVDTTAYRRARVNYEAAGSALGREQLALCVEE